MLLPPASAVEVIESVPSVCVCVCPSVNALTAERLDVLTQNLVSGCSWSMPWMSLMAKVKGQGRQLKKLIFLLCKNQFSPI